MREAGVDLVSVGVFSWALLEPEHGRVDFGWLDQVIDLLHAGGIARRPRHRHRLAAALADPTAPRDPAGATPTASALWPGGRQAWCPSSPVLPRALARGSCEPSPSATATIPPLVLWHVSNELGGHNALCYCDVSAAAFRDWLRDRYGTLDGLNDAWGTAFWSQHYGDWEEILPPRDRADLRQPDPAARLPPLLLRRAAGAATGPSATCCEELTPDVPVTTNFMATEAVRNMDYWSWAADVDLVSNDHYLDAPTRTTTSSSSSAPTSPAASRAAAPWWLMEHSTAPSTGSRATSRRRPARCGATACAMSPAAATRVLFFQWRQSRAGAEKFHSALRPARRHRHRGLARGRARSAPTSSASREVAGTAVRHDVAMVFDWQSWWAAELDSPPDQ